MGAIRLTILVVSVVAVIVALAAIMIPFGIERYAVSWLGDQGVPSRDLEDVDFNPFTGTLRLNMATFSGADDQRGEVGVAALNFQWTGLFRRKLMLSSFALRDTRIDVRKLDDGRYSIGGLVVPFATEGVEEIAPDDEHARELLWGLGVTDVAVENVELTYKDELIDSRVMIHRLSVDRVATWISDVSTNVLADIELDGSTLKVRAEVFPFAKEPNVTAKLQLERLDLGRYVAAFAAAGIAEAEGALSLDLQPAVRRRQNGDVDASLSGTVEAAGLAATLAQSIVRSDDATWSGNLAVKLPSNAAVTFDLVGDNDFDVKGFSLQLLESGAEFPSSLALEELSVDLTFAAQQYADKRLAVELAGSAGIEQFTVTSAIADLGSGRISWSGDLAATVNGKQPAGIDVSGTTDLAVSEFAIDAREQPIRLLAFEKLAFTELNITSLDSLSIREVSLSALEVLRKRQAEQVALSIAATAFEDLRMTDRSMLEIKNARLDTVVANLVRREDGELALVSDALDLMTPRPTDRGSSDEPAPQQPESPRQSGATEADVAVDNGFTFSVAKLEIAGKSRVAVQDNFVKPSVSTQVLLDKVLIENLGNVDLTQPAKITLELRQDDTTKLTASGDIWPFIDIASDIKLSLRGFDLTQVSSYVPAYNIQRGRLSLESAAKLRDDKLDVANTVVIEKLKLSAKAGGEQGMLGTGMAMPLDVALDLLRDSEDRIKLEMPVTGSLSNPEFGTGQIMRLALQGALQKAALSYAKNALQPLGTIMLVAAVAGKAARPRFDPLTFAAGLAEITPDSAAYLDKIAEMIRERPGLSITFCGVSTLVDRDFLLQAAGELTSPDDVPASDAANLDDQAATPPPPLLENERLELARRRGTAVQDYLVTKHGVDPERLFRCRPMLDAESTELPRVEIML